MPDTKRRGASTFGLASGRAFWIRTALVAIIDALAITGLVQFAQNDAWALFTLTIISVVAVNWAYLSPRTQAARWLTPGMVMMVVFVAYPTIYTTYLSFTNFQTGNLLTRQQAIERLEEVKIRTGESGELLDMFVYRNGDDELALLVVGEGQPAFAGNPRGETDDPALSPIIPPADLGGFDPVAPLERIDDYDLLTGLAVTGENRRLQDAVLDLPGGGAVQVETLSSARVVTGGLRFTYDGDSDTLYDAQFDRTCRGGEGTFVCDGVPVDEVQRVALLSDDTIIRCGDTTCDNVPLFALDQTLAGWREVIGPDNYQEIFTNDRIRDPFLRVFTWNVTFAVLSVLLTFSLGLSLALALKNEDMRFRSVYRSIYILAYAIPGFLSILVWRGLLNPEFGQVNGLLEGLGLPSVDWLSGSGTTAQIAVLLVNTWLGFPYMFLICSGALTSIPEELLEAARVDGAGPWRVFRMVTLPLLLVSTAPLLIGSFAFNFNNFVLIFLLTNGGPPLSGYDVPVGATDILISFTFDLAAGAGRGAQFGLASAIVVLIFLVLATTAGMSFRLTKQLEEFYG